ncbi:hypothetical protein G4B88_007432 [Cannabis sativa]|uniref:Stress-response A/B barrel domain-containing protein n=1 Tax=Cannabis sativa TaxID=3483 RepID=A0A7J6E767_CANSA|nr:hypothetical protein G4B88_007432 [Cannabis sativa]
MGEANKGVVKHVFILKMKEGLSDDQIEQMNKDYANLVNLVPSMKALQWGKLEVNNKLGNGGYTHIFESTFESMEGVAEYADHPAHLHLRNLGKVVEMSPGNYKHGNGGYTHIFESTFESMEGVAEYTFHPAHLHLGHLYSHTFDKVLVFDYIIPITTISPNSSTS